MKTLAQIKRITGRIIMLNTFEEVSGTSITDDRIVVKVDRAQSKQVRGGNWRVTKRGVTLHTFVKVDGEWKYLPPFTQWWSTDEIHGEPAKERDTEWELLHKRRR